MGRNNLTESFDQASRDLAAKMAWLDARSACVEHLHDAAARIIRAPEITHDEATRADAILWCASELAMLPMPISIAAPEIPRLTESNRLASDLERSAELVAKGRALGRREGLASE